MIAPYHLVKPRLVKALLDHGADPNEKFEKRTCWERALQWQHESYASAASAAGTTLDEARKIAEDRVEIFRLLVRSKPMYGHLLWRHTGERSRLGGSWRSHLGPGSTRNP